MSCLSTLLHRVVCWLLDALERTGNHFATRWSALQPLAASRTSTKLGDDKHLRKLQNQRSKHFRVMQLPENPTENRHSITPRSKRAPGGSNRSRFVRCTFVVVCKLFAWPASVVYILEHHAAEEPEGIANSGLGFLLGASFALIYFWSVPLTRS